MYRYDKNNYNVQLISYVSICIYIYLLINPANCVIYRIVYSIVYTLCNIFAFSNADVLAYSVTFKHIEILKISFENS
jgi:hypothetical protein